MQQEADGDGKSVKNILFKGQRNEVIDASSNICPNDNLVIDLNDSECVAGHNGEQSYLKGSVYANSIKCPIMAMFRNIAGIAILLIAQMIK